MLLLNKRASEILLVDRPKSLCHWAILTTFLFFDGSLQFMSKSMAVMCCYKKKTSLLQSSCYIRPAATNAKSTQAATLFLNSDKVLVLVEAS